MNIISSKELERRWKELLKLLEGMIKEAGVGIGTGGGGIKPPTIEEKEEEKAWETFFDQNGINSDTDRKAWKKSKLKILDDEVQDAFDNGWNNIQTYPIINRKITSYKSYDQVTSNIDPIKHSKEQIDEVHELIKDIKKAEFLGELKEEEKINKDVYDEDKVPKDKNHEAVKRIIREQLPRVFKNTFELPAKSKLSDKEIELWRTTAGTGLGRNATNERKAFDNGWTTPGDIVGGLVAKYTTPNTKEETFNIEVLKVDKKQLDKAHEFLFKAKEKKTFKTLDDWLKEQSPAIKNQLDDSKLPSNSLNATRARKLWDNNWEASDIKIDEKGEIYVVYYNSTTNANEVAKGYDSIIALGDKLIKLNLSAPSSPQNGHVATTESTESSEVKPEEPSEEKKTWRMKMGGKGNPPRNKTLDGTGKNQTDNAIMDAWFALTLTGGGKALDNNGRQKEDIFELIGKYRATLKYKIGEVDNETKGDGITGEQYDSALKEINLPDNQWEIKESGKLTSAILNELLAPYFDKDVKKTDLEEWLVEKGGYRFEKLGEVENLPLAEIVDGQFTGNRFERTITGEEIERLEDEWTRQGRLDLGGALKLPFSYYHVNKIDIDDIRKEDGSLNDDIFCKIDPNTGKIDLSTGNLAVGTGIGKTTKTINCIIRGGESTKEKGENKKMWGNNVILISPNEGMVDDAYDHHIGWLQKNPVTKEEYKCVTHGVFHGSYNTLRYDLIHYINEHDDPEKPMGEYGLSIMTVEKLLGHVARLEVDPSKLAPGRDEQSEGKEKINELKEKLVTKEETIIVFDEAHLNDVTYQDTQTKLIKKGYKILRMSATFPDKDFSITTAKPRKVWLVNKFEPEYLKDENDKLLTQTKNGKTVNIEKWEREKTGIFLRTTEDEHVFEVDPTSSTSKKKVKKQVLWGGLTAEQKALLEKHKIPYVSFDRTNSGAVGGITEGMPEGSLFFFSGMHEMGYSPYMHNAILTGKTQLITLGKKIVVGKSITYQPWEYETPQEIPISKASMTQQIGRVARKMPGTAYLLSTDLKEVDVSKSKDLAYKFVSALLSEDEEADKILKNEFKNYGIRLGSYPAGKPKRALNYLRACFGLRDKFGYRPEAIFVGAGGTKPSESSDKCWPKFGIKPQDKSVDDELWLRHLGTPTPPKLDVEKAKQTILLMVYNTLTHQPDINKGFEFELENTLIKEIWKKKDSKDKELGNPEKQQAVKDVKMALYKFIRDTVDLGKKEYTEKEKLKFELVVALLRTVSEGKITVEREYKKKLPDGSPDETSKLKEDYSIKFVYKPKVAAPAA